MEENKNETVMSNSEVIVLSERQSRAVTLDTTIKTRVKIIGDNLYALCQELKEMRDGKLYQEIGYQNFEEYCENEVHISRQYAYDHIGVIENLPEDFVKTSLQNGGAKNKLMLIAKASEPVRTQIMQDDPELKESYRKMKARCKELEDKQKQAESRISELESENQDKQDKIISLERQNEELENQPRDTVFENDPETLEEIERLKSEIGGLKENILSLEAERDDLNDTVTELEIKVNEFESSPLTAGDRNRKQVEAEIALAIDNATKSVIQQNQTMQEESFKQICDLKRELAGKENQLAELQKQLDEKQNTPEESPEMKQFRSQLGAVGICMKQLLDFLGEYPDTAFLDKSENALKGVLHNLDEIRKQVQKGENYES